METDYDYKYYVIQFEELPYNNIPKYVCVPHNWILFRNMVEKKVAVRYPVEDPTCTLQRIIKGEPVRRQWSAYKADIKYLTNTIEDTQEWIATALTVDKTWHNEKNNNKSIYKGHTQSTQVITKTQCTDDFRDSKIKCQSNKDNPTTSSSKTDNITFARNTIFENDCKGDVQNNDLLEEILSIIYGEHQKTTNKNKVKNTGDNESIHFQDTVASTVASDGAKSTKHSKPDPLSMTKTSNQNISFTKGNNSLFNLQNVNLQPVVVLENLQQTVCSAKVCQLNSKSQRRSVIKTRTVMTHDYPMSSTITPSTHNSKRESTPKTMEFGQRKLSHEEIPRYGVFNTRDGSSNVLFENIEDTSMALCNHDIKMIAPTRQVSSSQCRGGSTSTGLQLINNRNTRNEQQTFNDDVLQYPETLKLLIGKDNILPSRKIRKGYASTTSDHIFSPEAPVHGPKYAPEQKHIHLNANDQTRISTPFITPNHTSTVTSQVFEQPTLHAPKEKYFQNPSTQKVYLEKSKESSAQEFYAKSNVDNSNTVVHGSKTNQDGESLMTNHHHDDNLSGETSNITLVPNEQSGKSGSNTCQPISVTNTANDLANMAIVNIQCVTEKIKYIEMKIDSSTTNTDELIHVLHRNLIERINSLEQNMRELRNQLRHNQTIPSGPQELSANTTRTRPNKLSERYCSYDENDDVLDSEYGDNCNETKIYKRYKSPKNNLNGGSFVFPPEFDPNDTRWTLKYRKLAPGLKELRPRSGIYVKEKELNRCLTISKKYSSLAYNLMGVVFSESALRVCNLKGHPNGLSVQRPRLDKKAITVMLNFIIEYAKKRNWHPRPLQAVTDNMRSVFAKYRHKKNNQ